MTTPFRQSVTLASIAEACDVSVSTVSRALSDPPCLRISAEVRDRIRRYAAASGYRRNPVGRSLRICRHETISLVLPPYFTQPPRSLDFDSHVCLTQWEVIFGIIEHARSFNYDVKLEPLQDNDFSFLSRKLDKGHTDGAIFLLTERMDSLFSRFSAEDFPYVTIDFGSSSEMSSMFASDCETGYHEAIAYFREKGHHRIGLLYVPQVKHSIVVQRVLRKVLEESKLYNPELFIESEDIFAIRRLVDQRFYESADVLFCSNDAMADMLRREFVFRNIKPHPQIVGYDNNPVYDKVSTIAVPRLEIARQAVTMLLEHLAGKNRIDERLRTRIPTRFLFRSEADEE